MSVPSLAASDAASCCLIFPRCASAIHWGATLAVSCAQFGYIYPLTDKHKRKVLINRGTEDECVPPNRSKQGVYSLNCWMRCLSYFKAYFLFVLVQTKWRWNTCYRNALIFLHCVQYWVKIIHFVFWILSCLEFNKVIKYLFMIHFSFCFIE